MVICGAADDRDVYIGSDSLIYNQLAPGLFVYRRASHVIGLHAQPALIYHLRTSFIPPKRSDTCTLEMHMATLFFKEFSLALSPYKLHSVEALIGSMGSVFYLNQGGVIQCIDKYAAIGQGSEIALGSLYSTMGIPPHKRIAVALSAASKHTHLVKPPYTILSTGLYAVSRYSPDFHSNMTEVDLSTL